MGTERCATRIARIRAMKKKRSGGQAVGLPNPRSASICFACCCACVRSFFSSRHATGRSIALSLRVFGGGQSGA